MRNLLVWKKLAGAEHPRQHRRAADHAGRVRLRRSARWSARSTACPTSSTSPPAASPSARRSRRPSRRSIRHIRACRCRRPGTSILNAPIALDDIVFAEMLWAAIKALFSCAAILVVIFVLGISRAPTMLLALPVLGLRRRHLRVARAGLQRARQGLRLLHLLLHARDHADDLPLGRVLSDRADAAVAAGGGAGAAAEGGGRPGAAARSRQHSRRSAPPLADPRRRMRAAATIWRWCSPAAASSAEPVTAGNRRRRRRRSCSHDLRPWRPPPGPRCPAPASSCLAPARCRRGCQRRMPPTNSSSPTRRSSSRPVPSMTSRSR